MSRYVFQVEGMSCEGCASSIRRALEAEGLARRVEIDVGAKKAVVESAGTEAEPIREAIEAIGFDARLVSVD